MKDMVEKYIALRDARALLDSAYKLKKAPLDAAMDKIEAAILAQFEASQIESVRTEGGTAYKSKKTSATVADWDLVLAYIKANDLWQMLEQRVSKKAVEEFVEAHSDLPPGINWREEVTINVRRT